MKDLEKTSVPTMAVEFDRYLLSASPPRAEYYLYNTAESLEEYVLHGCFEEILVGRSGPKNRGKSSPQTIRLKNCELKNTAKDDSQLDDWVSDIKSYPSEKLCVPGHGRSSTTEDLSDLVDFTISEEYRLPPASQTRRLSKSKSESSLNKNSDGKKKRVSFADESGDRLATYQMIPRGESQYIFDDSGFILSYTERPFTSSSILRSSLDSVTSYTSQPIKATDLLPTCVDPVSVCSLGFDQPSSSFSSFLNRLDRDSVCLENAKVEGADVLCTVRVKNIAFEKQVFARITFDNWLSFQDIPARYVPCGVSAPLYDTFSFQIKSPPDNSLKNRHPCNTEFAICYRANGNEFWDSNKGSNYKVMWMLRHRCSRPA